MLCKICHNTGVQSTAGQMWPLYIHSRVTSLLVTAKSSPLSSNFYRFYYRAMHFSASAVLRSHVVCLSVCPSVTLVDCDHIGWNSSKLISPFVSMGCSLFATPNMTYGSAPRGTPLNLGPKWPTPCWFERRRHSIANCGRMIVQRSQWRAYRKLPSLFLMVPTLPP